MCVGLTSLCQPLTPSLAPEAQGRFLLHLLYLPTSVSEELKAEKEEKMGERRTVPGRERDQETWEGTDHRGSLRCRVTGQGGLSDSRKSPGFRVTVHFRTTEMGQDLAWDHSAIRGSVRVPAHSRFSLTEEGELEEHSRVRISLREAAGPWRASASGTPTCCLCLLGWGRVGGLLPEGLLG